MANNNLSDMDIEHPILTEYFGECVIKRMKKLNQSPFQIPVSLHKDYENGDLDVHTIGDLIALVQKYRSLLVIPSFYPETVYFCKGIKMKSPRTSFIFKASSVEQQSKKRKTAQGDQVYSEFVEDISDFSDFSSE